MTWFSMPNICKLNQAIDIDSNIPTEVASNLNNNNYINSTLPMEMAFKK